MAVKPIGGCSRSAIKPTITSGIRGFAHRAFRNARSLGHRWARGRRSDRTSRSAGRCKCTRPSRGVRRHSSHDAAAPRGRGAGLLVGSCSGCSLSVTVARHRTSAAAARSDATPAVLACLRRRRFAGPALDTGRGRRRRSGTGRIVWVPRLARSPTASPRVPRTTPDRGSPELISQRSWPTAIPGGVAELAARARRSRSMRTDLFGSHRGSARALAVFFGARGVPRVVTSGGLAVGSRLGNGVICLSSFYGWQAQLLLTTAPTYPLHAPRLLQSTFRTHGLRLVVRGLRNRGLRKWFVPRLSSLAILCWNCWRAASSGSGRWISRAGCRRLSVSLSRSDRRDHTGVGSQHLTQSLQNFWNQYAWAFPSDALGLVPRSPRESTLREVLAGVVAAVRGLRFARSSPRGMVLVPQQA